MIFLTFLLQGLESLDCAQNCVYACITSIIAVIAVIANLRSPATKGLDSAAAMAESSLYCIGRETETVCSGGPKTLHSERNMALRERLQRGVGLRLHLIILIGALLSSAGVVAVDQGSIPTAPFAPVAGPNPTRSPASFPTTRIPTGSPTTVAIVPTPWPTSGFTLAPIGSVNPPPSPVTWFPTASPSLSPTLELSRYLISVVMYLEFAQFLGSSSEITFQRITGAFIEEELVGLDELDWTDVSVGTNVKSQRELTELPAAGIRRMRSLQAPVSVLEIIFDTQVSLRSELDSLDIAGYIGGAFNTWEDRAAYIEKLQSSGDKAFSYVTSSTVVINGKEQDVPDPPAVTEPPASGGMSTYTIYIIIGAAGGALCISILATLFYCRHRGKRKPVTIASTNNSGGQMGERVGADIVTDNQDDISTLGDPMYAPGGMMMGGGLERDETVAASIVSGDWDYAKNYGIASGPDTRTRADTLQSSQNGSYGDLSSFGGLTKMDNSIFSDDLSFEQQFVEVEERFEVDAPAGKLGMVIDTPSGGVPIVHAIKDSSVLADRVEVGDRLISVDDEDTTGLTALQVSKLISRKVDNPSRILVFARTRARAMPGEGMPQ